MQLYTDKHHQPKACNAQHKEKSMVCYEKGILTPRDGWSNLNKPSMPIKKDPAVATGVLNLSFPKD